MLNIEMKDFLENEDTSDFSHTRMNIYFLSLIHISDGSSTVYVIFMIIGIVVYFTIPTWLLYTSRCVEETDVKLQ